MQILGDAGVPGRGRLRHDGDHAGSRAAEARDDRHRRSSQARQVHPARMAGEDVRLARRRWTAHRCSASTTPTIYAEWLGMSARDLEDLKARTSSDSSRDSSAPRAGRRPLKAELRRPLGARVIVLPCTALAVIGQAGCRSCHRRHFDSSGESFSRPLPRARVAPPSHDAPGVQVPVQSRADGRSGDHVYERGVEARPTDMRPHWSETWSVLPAVALAALCCVVNAPGAYSDAVVRPQDFRTKALFELEVSGSKVLRSGASKIVTESAFVTLTHTLLGNTDGLEIQFFTKPITGRPARTSSRMAPGAAEK